MNSEIAPIFKQYEKSKLDLFADLDKLDSSLMNKKVNEKTWSVVQVMNHLIEAEMNTIKYVNKKLSGNTTLPKSGLGSLARYLILRIAFVIPFAKYKAPPVLSVPSNDDTYEVAKNNWLNVLDEMKNLIEKLDERQLKSEIFKHPVVGKMNMIQSLKFIQTHFNRHEIQINQILKQFN
jgi:uncharacterized damage-inducible protein DinB